MIAERSTTAGPMKDRPAPSNRQQPGPSRQEPAGERPGRAFDGVICFGDSDWWYHNRGHYDMQMMRQFSRYVPVLYVNSIGLRVPRLGKGGMFWPRVKRKLKSLCRGLVAVQDNFSVYSPLVVPGRIGMLCSRPMMAWQIRWAMRRLHIRRPLVWVVCPPAAAIVDALAPAIVVYQRTDRYEDYPGADADEIRRLDRLLKARADLTLFCSSYLLEDERDQCRQALFADHGVDFERFAGAGERADAQNEQPDSSAGSYDHGSATAQDHATRRDSAEAGIHTRFAASFPRHDSMVTSSVTMALGAGAAPGAAPLQDNASVRMASIPRPRVGFVGGIDAHTFGPQLFHEVARLLPEANFVLVGACSLPEGWCPAPNVTMLGQQPYEQVAEYMAACDVLIMPWNNSDWIRACNPVKLKEYLAVGRPVVSTPFEELRRYEGFVRVARSSQEFASHIRQALADPPEAQRLRERVRQETWAAKAQLVLEALNKGVPD